MRQHRVNDVNVGFPQNLLTPDTVRVMNVLERLGERLRDAREHARLSKKATGKLLGVSADTVGRWESGAIEPKAMKIEGMAKLYKVTADYLLRLSEYPVGLPPEHYVHSRTQLKDFLSAESAQDVASLIVETPLVVQLLAQIPRDAARLSPEEGNIVKGQIQQQIQKIAAGLLDDLDPLIEQWQKRRLKYLTAKKKASKP